MSVTGPLKLRLPPVWCAAAYGRGVPKADLYSGGRIVGDGPDRSAKLIRVAPTGIRFAGPVLLSDLAARADLTDPSVPPDQPRLSVRAALGRP